jgi:hypothetical protein
LLRAAVETIRAGGALARCPALFLDVPIHSAAEQDFLVALAEFSPKMLKFGVDQSNLNLLEILDQIKQTAPLP